MNLSCAGEIRDAPIKAPPLGSVPIERPQALQLAPQLGDNRLRVRAGMDLVWHVEMAVRQGSAKKWVQPAFLTA